MRMSLSCHCHENVIMFHHHPAQILKCYKYWSCQLRCRLSAARCQLGRSVLAQHIAIVSWAAKCQLIGRLSAPLRFASSASNAQLQSLGSIATCQLSLTLSWICRFVHQNWPQPHPSAIAGCADKLEFCKVLYVPIGGPAHVQLFNHRCI